MITVVIADHKKSGRAACRQVLQLEKGMEGVGEARSGLEAMAVAARFKPCILLFHLLDAGEAWVPRKMVAKIIDRLARLTAGQEGG